MIFKPKSDKPGESNYRAEAGIPSIIAGDMSILGNLISEGAIEIAGRIEGNIKCGSLNVFKDAIIKGDVIARSVKINGEVNGVVKAKNVIVAEFGKVHGHIIYETITISEGATIFGQMKQIERNELHQGDHRRVTDAVASKIKLMHQQNDDSNQE